MKVVYNSIPSFWNKKVESALTQTKKVWRNYNYYLNISYKRLIANVVECLSFNTFPLQPALLKTDLWDTLIEKERSVIALLPASLKRNITIIDTSSKLVSLAKKNLNYKTMQCDLKDLPFPNSSFDVILDCSTIDHIDKQNIQKVINGYERVLNNSGTLLLVYARSNIIIETANVFFSKLFHITVFDYYEKKHGQYFFTDNLILDCVRKNPKLRIRRTYYFGFLLHFPARTNPVSGLFSMIPKVFLRLISSLELTPGITLLFKPFSLFSGVVIQKEMNLEQTNKYWKLKEQQYSGDKISLWPYSLWNYFIGLENKYFLNKVLRNIKEGDSILDFGCGTGRVSKMIVKRTKNITLVDFSKKSLNICLSRLAKAGVKPRYYRCSFTDFDYGTKVYDCIISIVSLSFITERGVYFDTLKLLLNSLKNGGILILMERFGLYSSDIPIIKITYKEVVEYIESEGYQVVNKHVVDSMRVRLIYLFLEKVKDRLYMLNKLVGVPVLLLQICFLPFLFVFETLFPENFKKDSNYVNLTIKRT